ncbi:uncharacterized protein LOC132736239 [Ruditapes philippinarum]|uniref:uncharacterized protein LOC132736239 n=1 Tax=Ruditapes philippinarum TaxID=129788 RepID=UPI00295C0BAE|nr:uncharacterized protein LOC132736239 [Ruditapes philippinarum]
METLTLVLLALAIVVQVRGPNHDHPPHDNHHPDHNCHGPECDDILRALHDIGANFDDHVCHVFKDIDCTQHVLPDDEQICGSDGFTYADHCLFVKARCVIILDPHKHDSLTIYNHGPCVDPTTTAPTPAVVSTTLGPATATSSWKSTVQPLNGVLGSVFCQYKSSITCSVKLDVVCGSNGNLFPNMCELMMVQCSDPTLRAADTSMCLSSP